MKNFYIKEKNINIIHTQNLIIIFFMIIISFLFFLFINSKNNNKIPPMKNIVINNEKPPNNYGLFSKPNYSYSNIDGDVLLNPYQPPLKDSRYFLGDMFFGNGGRVPINVRTSSIDTNYRQIGILKSANGTKILPLIGRPLQPNRNTWNYYTNDEKNNIKLPIIYKKKSCTSEYGCNELYNKDKVFVKGYDKNFIVEIYDNDTIRYLPFV